MTTTPLPPQTKEAEITSKLYDLLTNLPRELGGAYAEAAALVNLKRQEEITLEIAELNALLQAPSDGKNEAARELQRRKALQDDAAYQAARKRVMDISAEIELSDAEIKGKQKEFQAAIALAELHAARMNAYTTRLQHQQKDEDKAK